MLDGKNRAKLSVAGRAITGAAVATLLVVAFALAIFTRDKVEASRPSSSQDPTPAVIVPMLFENLPAIPLVVVELQASLSEARPVKFQGETPDGQIVDLTHKGELERDLSLTVRLLNQGDRAVSGIAMRIQNPSFWAGEVSGMMILTGLVENESGHIVIEPQQTFTFNQRERVKEQNNGVELMSSIGDFRFKIVGVRFEPDRSWIWAKDVVEKGIVMTQSSHSATSSDVVYTAATDKVAFNGNLSFDGKSYVLYSQIPSSESGERGIDRPVKLIEDPSVVDYINKVGQNLVLPSNAKRPAQKNGESANIIEPMTAYLRPTILYKEKPRYTDQARQNGVEGTVVLNVVFGADGRITGIRIIRGLPDGLTEKAIEAAQLIRFEPPVKDGQRVSVRGNLEFSFNLDKSAGKSTSEQGEPGTFSGIEPMSVWMRPTILYKEKAQYTEEARQNKVQGTVVLNVIFRADGTIGNIEVVHGLPYGLSEQAIAAARLIRFEPALKNGKPVNVRGNLEFTFNLY